LRAGRAALVLLQLVPAAFVFRVRANHEYPMLLCLLAALVALDGVRRSWVWLPAVAAAITAALLIKGVFVAIVLLGGALAVSVGVDRVHVNTFLRRQEEEATASAEVSRAAGPRLPRPRS